MIKQRVSDECAAVSADFTLTRSFQGFEQCQRPSFLSSFSRDLCKMQYPSIVESILDQFPNLLQKLRRDDSLCSTIDRLSAELRESHQSTLNQLRGDFPEVPIEILNQQALEIETLQIQLKLADDFLKESN